MPFIGKNPTAGFASIVKDSFTPNGSATSFTLSKQVANANDIAVFVGNVRQQPTTAYTVNGTTLDFGSGNAPASGLDFYVLHIAGTHESSVVPADGTISTAKLQSSTVTNAKINFPTKTTMIGDGSDTTLTINSGRTVDDVLVFVNGICLVPTDDYTISGTTLTFITAPSVGSEVTVRYIG
tara:strand:+ start:158 stop:700 length:543 start_codon:yes stop_codon:yes gene_type:complete